MSENVEWLKKKVKKKKKVEDKPKSKITKIPASAYFPKPTIEEKIYNQTLENKKEEENLLLEMRALAHAKQLKIKTELEKGTKPVYVTIKKRDENDDNRN